LSVGNTLYAISQVGLTLTASKTEDTLKAYPAESITPKLAEVIREYKAYIIHILREDAEMHHTGIIQSERQVFELAREHFGLGSEGGAT
jgi:hypothetical protein